MEKLTASTNRRRIESNPTYDCVALRWLCADGVWGQGKNEANLERYQLAEVKHGRLAMIAFSGFVHQVGPFPACCGSSPYLRPNSLDKSTRKARRKAPQPQHCNKAIRTGIGVSNQYNTISTLL